MKISGEKNIFKLRKIFFFFLMMICSAAEGVISQEKIYYDKNDPIFLQSTPIFEGMEAFEKRISEIKKEREPFALVLSGGSARAYAHIGVLRELEKNNVRPDFIVANSMGAIIGLFYSAGFSPDDIEYIVSSVNMNSLFDLVLPIKSGLLNARYFKEALSRLFPDRTFDIKDSYIPIVVPIEDLISKRLVYFGSGDITEVMVASFAMPFTMESADYTLSDGTPVKLTDSGTIDLGQIAIAKKYTDNILVSTAFNNSQVDLDNVAVVINRCFSIGKERVLVSDLIENNIPFIRNDVENYSFMDFAKVCEIISKGEKCCRQFLEDNKEFLENANFCSFDFSDPDFVALRNLRSEYTKNFVYGLTHGEEPFSMQKYFGMKVRPSVPVIDTPDFFLRDDLSVGVYGIFDYRNTFIRAGVFGDLEKNFGVDGTFAFTSLNGANDVGALTYLRSQWKLLAWNEFDFSYFIGQEFFVDFHLSDVVRLSPRVVAEFDGDPFVKNILMCNGGIEFEILTRGLRFDCEPYVYYFNDKIFDSSFSFADFMGHSGIGAIGELSLTYIPFIGFSVADSFRWQPESYGARLFAHDSYRGRRLAVYTENTTSTYFDVLQTELYFYSLESKLTFMEAFKLEKFKAGLFYDTIFMDNNMTSVAGAFTQLQISLSGLFAVNTELYAGYDIEDMSPVWGIAIKRNW